MSETFTVAFSCGTEVLTLGVAVKGWGELVSDGSDRVGVSVISSVSVIVGLVVNVRVIVGVSEGVKDGGCSRVGVKVDLIWKGVFVEVPFMVYF